MPWVNGQILTENGFREGSLEFAEEIITYISEMKSKQSLAEGLILPLFTNPHTHIGDSFIQEDLEGTIEEIVAPPHGLKHARLEQASDEEVVEGMRQSLDRMNASGVSNFVDFREGGVKGVSLLLNACLDSPVNPVVYGRPKSMEYDKEEVKALLKVVDGIGISSVQDWDGSVLEKLTKDVNISGRGFATHASESVRENIDTILDLKPRFLIHMIEANESDLERCADAGVPVVVCPRSNAHFEKVPPVAKMLSKGVDVMLGTDNAMLSSPSLFDEMRFLRQMTKQDPNITTGSILQMAMNSGKVLKGQSALSLKTGQPSEFLVLEWDGNKPERFIVERASEKHISFIARGRRLWARKDGHLKEESNWPKKDPRRQK
jgi:cytosine/adenosine deaminase-related metal-dependent hydrolase